jgi:excisionase family DNA binding protein
VASDRPILAIPPMEAGRGPGRQDRNLLSIKTAATWLDVTEATLRKWLAERRLPVVKLGRLTRLRIEDLCAIAMTGLPPKGAHPREREPRGAAA